MEFTEAYEMYKQDYSKCQKKEAYEHVQGLISAMQTNGVEPCFFGQALARLEAYFAPPLTPKKEPIDWCIQALNPKDKRKYTNYGLIIENIGLCCTDAKHLHILKKFENDKPVIDIKKEWKTLEDIGEEDVEWYPPVSNVMPDKFELQEFTDVPKVIDNERIGINDAEINRKHFNQAIGGMKDYKIYYAGPKKPVFIEDETKLALIMPFFQ